MRIGSMAPCRQLAAVASARGVSSPEEFTPLSWWKRASRLHLPSAVGLHAAANYLRVPFEPEDCRDHGAATGLFVGTLRHPSGSGLLERILRLLVVAVIVLVLLALASQQ